MSCHAFTQISILLFPFSHLYFKLGLHALSPLNQRGRFKAARVWKLENVLKTFKKKEKRKTKKTRILNLYYSYVHFCAHFLHLHYCSYNEGEICRLISE